jgi:hypothetical protein
MPTPTACSSVDRRGEPARRPRQLSQHDGAGVRACSPRRVHRCAGDNANNGRPPRRSSSPRSPRSVPRVRPASTASRRWGANGQGQASPPLVSFLRIAAGNDHPARSAAAMAPCSAGATLVGEGNPPPGTFRDVQAGEQFTCGITTSGSLTCWGATASAS